MKGDEPITINWSLKGDVISSDPELSTTMLGTRTSMLTISSVSHRHIGTYTCRATNPAGSVTHSANLNVNGNLFINVLMALEIFFSTSGDSSIFLWSRNSEPGGSSTDNVHN